MHSKWPITFSFPVLLNSPIAWSILFPGYPMPGTTNTFFVDTFLVFWKGVLLLITTFCIVYVFLHALIFSQPVWTSNWTTFQTVENNFPDWASIYCQLTFFTFHWAYFTLQRWTDKCQCRALKRKSIWKKEIPVPILAPAPAPAWALTKT